MKNKTRTSLVSLVLLMLSFPLLASSVDNAASKLAADLEKAYGKKGKIYLAVADIVVPTNPDAQFGEYLTTSLTGSLKGSAAFMVVDQEGVSSSLKKMKMLFNKPYDYAILNKVSQAIHSATQVVPQGYLYGQIKDLGKEIQITLKAIDAISGSTIAMASVKFPSDEITDGLLGKPVREVKAAASQPTVLEKPVQEKAVVASSAAVKFKVDVFQVELKSATLQADRTLTLNFLVTNESEDQKRFVFNVGRTSIFDAEGNQYNGEGASIGSSSNERVNDFGANVPSQIPVKATVNFLKVSSKLKEIKAVQLYILDREFMLKNIPIINE